MSNTNASLQQVMATKCFLQMFLPALSHAFCRGVAAWVHRTTAEVTRQTFAQVCVWLASTNISSFCKYFNGRNKKIPPSPLTFFWVGSGGGSNTCKMCLNQLLFQNNNVDLEHFEPHNDGDVVLRARLNLL